MTESDAGARACATDDEPSAVTCRRCYGEGETVVHAPRLP